MEKRTKRTVVVRRSVGGKKPANGEEKAQAPAVDSHSSSLQKKNVLVARKVEIDDDTFATETIPESVFRHDPIAQGPRFTEEGKLIAHSVLGDPEEFEASAKAKAMESLIHGAGGAERNRDSVVVNPSTTARTTPAPRSAMALGSVAEGGDEEMSERETQASKTFGVSSVAPSFPAKSGEASTVGRRVAQRRGNKYSATGTDDAAKRQERALKRYEEMQREWEKFRERMSQKMGRDADDLVFARSEDFREMLEEYDLLQKAVPLEERQASNIWLMSLRNSWTTFVPVGNTFSGLFCPVVERTAAEPNDVTFIRNPDAVAARIEKSLGQADEGGHRKKKGRRTWRDSAFLQKRLNDLKKTLDKLRPHVPATKEFKVVGQSVREGDETRRQRELRTGEGEFEHRSSEEGTSAFLPPVVLSDTQHFQTGLSLTNLDQISTNRTVGSDGTAAIRYSTVGVVNESEQDLEAVRGPALSVTAERLFFESYIGDGPEAKIVTLTNLGSTCLYLRIHKKERETKLKRRTDDTQRFFMDKEKYTLLPGKSVDVRFIYASETVGMFLDAYVVETVPALKQSVSIHLKGITKGDDDAKLSRKLFEQQLKEKEKMTVVKDTIESMIRNVHTPRKDEPKAPVEVKIPSSSEMREAVEAHKFKEANSGLGVYYSPEAYGTFASLYQRVVREKGAKDAEETTQEWDSSVRTLHDLIVTIRDDQIRTQFLSDFNASVRIASEKPSVDSLHYAVGYHSFMELFDAIPRLYAQNAPKRNAINAEEEEQEEQEEEPKADYKAAEKETDAANKAEAEETSETATTETPAQEGIERRASEVDEEKTDEEAEEEEAVNDLAIPKDDPILKDPFFRAVRSALCSAIDSFALLCEEGDRRSLALAMSRTRPASARDGKRPPVPPPKPESEAKTEQMTSATN